MLMLLFTKLEKRAEQVLPGSEWGDGRGENNPNNVCPYEYME